jgi:hypothetical protein
MEALGAACELVKAAFQVPNVTCYDLYFTGVEGARIHAKLCVPRANKPLPAVINFHGYTGRAPDFSWMLSWAAGFVIAAMDCRGQGGQSEDVGGVKGNTYCGHFIRVLVEGRKRRSKPKDDKLPLLTYKMMQDYIIFKYLYTVGLLSPQIRASSLTFICPLISDG